MRTIEIDFDVFRELTCRRSTEEFTCNDVIRDLLELPKVEISSEQQDEKPWVVKNVSFPHGTQFYANFRCTDYRARVENGALVFKGKRFYSPSSAAMEITKYPINGWMFWECLVPGSSTRRLINDLRKNR